MTEEILESGELYRERPKKEVKATPIEQFPVKKSSVKMEQVPTSAIPQRAPLEPQEKLEDLNLETDLGEEARSIAIRRQREKEKEKAEEKQEAEQKLKHEIQQSPADVLKLDPIPPFNFPREPSLFEMQIQKMMKITGKKEENIEPELQTTNSKSQTDLPQTTNYPPQTGSKPQTTQPQTPITDDIYELEGDLESKTESGFALLEKLGTGGQGEVYRAKDLKTGEEVAIKYGDDLDKEVLAKKLNHPNITRIKSSGEDKKGKFIAREYVKGKSLAELLKEGKLPYEKVLKFGKQIVEAVKHLHDNDIVYGDLKSENVLVSEDLETAKITDFGLSRDIQTDGLSHSVKTTTIKGTPRYMAPERIKKGQKATKQSDVYELGELLFEMLTGDVLLGPDDERLETWQDIVVDRIAFGKDKPKVCYSFEEVKQASLGNCVGHCLRSNPNKRFRVGELVRNFNVLIEEYEEERKKLEAVITKKFDEFEEKQKQEALAKQPEQTQTASLDNIVEKEKEGWTWKKTLKSLIPGYPLYRLIKSKFKKTDNEFSDESYGLAIFGDFISAVSYASFIDEIAKQQYPESTGMAIGCCALLTALKSVFCYTGALEEDSPANRSSKKIPEANPQTPSPNYKPKEETPAGKSEDFKKTLEALDDLKKAIKNNEESSVAPRPVPHDKTLQQQTTEYLHLQTTNLQQQIKPAQHTNSTQFKPPPRLIQSKQT